MTNQTITIKQAFGQAAKSRVFITLWVVIGLQMILALILLFSVAKIGQPGVPYRYDGFSDTSIYRDNGSYLLNFGFFVLVIPFLNVLVSLKLYAVKGRNIGLAALWITVAVLTIAVVFLLALLNIGNVL
jgi:hypothetical protein